MLSSLLLYIHIFFVVIVTFFLFSFFFKVELYNLIY